ncbi:hypothetical protein [Arthrobacter sedimenti]|uniref:hypothetical protein n=1 Tax=Arthrobacter sedimenti TaxID=2694931 RepID=UPI000B3645A9|nr:hypothetical protein [Arthrobacter sedimenti]OUM41187.1 hypothetical protein B8W73_12695 [Arthrobacter agilis]
MTESSSAGNPAGAALPADHPLGPAVPIPPLEKEARRSGQEPSPEGTAAPTGRRDSASDVSTGTSGPAGASRSRSEHGDSGRPHRDRRENALDPSPGSGGHHGTSIRDEQHTHEAGVVPAAYVGAGTPEHPDENRHPEDAVLEPDSWDHDTEED